MTQPLLGMRVRHAGSGDPLLLLHAFPLSGAQWEPQIQALAERHTLLVPDLPGFGGSPAPGEQYTLDDVADSLAATLDRYRVPRVAVCGLSMGGYIAFAMLRRHPERVARLVLADTRAGADTEQARAGRETNAQLAETSGSAAIADKMLPSLLSPGAPPALVAHLRALIAGNAPRGIALALRAMAQRPDSSDLLGAIAAPTLVIVGADDALTPPDEARRMQEAIPGCRLVVIPDAGHISNLEQPQVFSQALGSFL
jgi:pimeloyl-ACP methyl ester carboxylesterase